MMRRSPRRRPAFRIGWLALAVALAAAGCGKKGPPLPPIRVVPAATGPLTLHQIGREVLLAANLPGLKSDGTPMAAGGTVRVLRLEAPEGLRPGAVSDRYLVQQFERQAHEVASFDDATLPAHVEHGRFYFVDANPAGTGGAAGLKRFLYGLQVVDAKGARSPLRPPTYVEWNVPPEAPTGLKAEVAEGEVRLSWTPPAPPPSPGSASAAKKFAVYRREAAAPREPEAPVHPGLIDAPAYVDRTFRYDTDYLYTVRAVATAGAGSTESASSEPLAVRPHDSFPPAVPQGLAVAAEGDAIKVYWFPNTEPDLAGYRVYRRQEGKTEAARVAEVSASETSWMDPEAAAGVRYHYSVSAFDATTPANESPRSDEHSERRPAPQGSRP
ncbi:MAG TPA: fibronectin type III domain-containing protein [Candidatus Polarisedimenticolia bacterium]|nr:fibronectin type III domain-containing protein [Candidatus Polarisedimenticolia bacterium]